MKFVRVNIFLTIIKFFLKKIFEFIYHFWDDTSSIYLLLVFTQFYWSCKIGLNHSISKRIGMCFNDCASLLQTFSFIGSFKNYDILNYQKINEKQCYASINYSNMLSFITSSSYARFIITSLFNRNISFCPEVKSDLQC